ncbi:MULTISPECIES: hypothetical protein [unclassified Streptomyces]
MLKLLARFSVHSGTKAYISHLTRLLPVEPGMVDTNCPTTSPTPTRPS